MTAVPIAEGEAMGSIDSLELTLGTGCLIGGTEVVWMYDRIDHHRVA
ncbi:hypothetical protein [Nocardia sp. NPDC004123]